jgi:NAD(P)-dependent dehydrogenase (short-subunit alcohol dehydrogenase family)
MDTNLYGVVNVTRAAIPIMRKQRSGCILQVSSVGGRLAVPGSAGYHAAKWAVGGFTETIAQEVAPFGVKVCALEPGGMRTNWGTRAHQDLPELLPDYEPSVGAVVKALRPLWGKENSDPAKVAQSCGWLTAKNCRRIFCSAAMLFNTPARLRPPERRRQSAGMKSVSRPTWKRMGRCLIYDSETGRA